MTSNYTYRGRHRAESATRTRRNLALLGTVTAAAAGFGVAPAMAAPADELQAGLTNAQAQFSGEALAAHDAAQEQASQVPAEYRDVYQQSVTDLTNIVAPGALAQRDAERAAAERAAAEAAAAQARQDAWNNTSDTPCPVSARACVDLDGRRAWLQDGGKTSYGPVYISSGAPGPDTATPRGSFHVVRKVRDEISHEFNDAPMPYSVYFTNSGHAFHQGDPNVDSAGCIHLSGADAVTFFDSLQVGDEVFIY